MLSITEQNLHDHPVTTFQSNYANADAKKGHITITLRILLLFDVSEVK